MPNPTKRMFALMLATPLILPLSVAYAGSLTTLPTAQLWQPTNAATSPFQPRTNGMLLVAAQSSKVPNKTPQHADSKVSEKAEEQPGQPATAHAETLEVKASMAARKGDLAQLKKQVALGAKLNEYSLNPAPPLFEAIMAGHSDIVKWLLANGAQLHVQGPVVSFDALDLAVRHKEDNSAMIRYLVSKGADVNAQAVLPPGLSSTNAQASGKGHGSLLWTAIDERKLKHARTLLQLQADPNVFGEGLTPLMNAAGKLNVEEVKLLLEFHADPKLKGPHAVTALQRAQKAPDIKSTKVRKAEVLKLLQAAGATE